MKELIEAVRELAHEENLRGIEEFGLFASNHEGIAVIEEELQEAREEIKEAQKRFKNLKSGIFKDEMDETKLIHASELFDKCVLTACEIIQTSAMAQKYIETKKQKGEGLTVVK